MTIFDSRGGSLRIFIALDIDNAIRQRIERFMDGLREFAPDVHWVKTESLHVTLKFIGEKPAEAVEQIRSRLSRTAADSFPLSFRGHGFFPRPKSARVFWAGIEAGPQLAKLAAQIDDATETLGIAKEGRTFSPHLTLARAGSGAPGRRKEDNVNRRFARLQDRLGALPSPEFGTMTACEFFLYESKISRDGASYSKIARFALKS